MATRRIITRSKTSSAAAGPSRSSGPAKRTGGFRGEEGRRQFEKEKAAAKERQEANKLNANQPFRFYTPDGETREIVILDSTPEFFRHEHAMENKETGRFDRYFECIAKEEECPVCEVDSRRASYIMYLSVLDLTEYEDRKGNVIPFSKKLLCVKPKQQEKIFRLLDKHKDLRGLSLLMTRDGKKDASIGGDIEDNGFMDEAEIVDHEYDFEDKEGKVHKVDMEPYDYDELFPEPTARQLEAAVGTGKTRGNRTNDREEVSRPTRAAARRGRSSGDDETDAADESDNKPVRGRGRGQEPDEADPPARGRGRGRSEETEPEAEAEAEERPSRRIASTRGRAAEEEADPPAREERTSRRRNVEEEPRSRGRAEPDSDDPPFEADPPARGRGRGRSEEADNDAEPAAEETDGRRRQALRRGARG